MKQFLSRWLIWIVAGAIEIGFLMAYPPFRLVDLEQSRIEKQSAQFDPQKFASDFWEGQMMASLDRAHPAADVLQVLRQAPGQAREQYGQIVGLGGPCYFFVRGTGRITAIHKRSIELSLNEDRSGEAEIVLQTAMIFGNQVLNASNLIQRSQFPRTNDFNDVSSAVNEIVEERVIPPLLEGLAVGDRLEFVGCSDEVTDDGAFLIPLKLVPVKARKL